MGKLERKFGKYAIRNLSLVLLCCYAVGYLIQMLPFTSGFFYFCTLDPYLILHGQVWRLITWVLIPPDLFNIWTIITLFFFYSIGRLLERAWGDWLYNVYIFSGMIFTVVITFIIYLVEILYLKNNGQVLFAMHAYEQFSATLASCVSTYYVNLSIILAFAMTFPDMHILLMFIIPLKAKWLGIFYVGLLLWEILHLVYAGDWIQIIIIVASVLNFVVFRFLLKSKRFGSPKMRFQQAVRRREYNKDIKNVSRRQGTISKHKCAICGKTEIDSPDMEFRFCSKCNGNYEYCSNHLFTHKHVE